MYRDVKVSKHDVILWRRYMQIEVVDKVLGVISSYTYLDSQIKKIADAFCS